MCCQGCFSPADAVVKVVMYMCPADDSWDGQEEHAAT